MALPTIARFAAQTLKGPFRDKQGRFISRTKYLRQQAAARQFRDPLTGRFKAGRLNPAQAEAWFRSRLDAKAPTGGWLRVAFKYRERFEDYVSDFEQTFGL
jgi:hypothetical protein